MENGSLFSLVDERLTVIEVCCFSKGAHLCRLRPQHLEVVKFLPPCALVCTIQYTERNFRHFHLAFPTVYMCKLCICREHLLPPPLFQSFLAFYPR